MSPRLQAAGLDAALLDATGQPLANAVLTLRGPLGGEGVPTQAVMDQQAKQFVPNVLAVRTGTSVSFPNSDNIRHHVYSFSPAKRFELRLYQGTPSEPVRFDKPGVVVLGCNIHDWMVGYVYVTDDPWFAVSDEQGQVRFADLPAGRYAVTLWHPQIALQSPREGGEVQVDDSGKHLRLSLAVEAPHDGGPEGPPASAFGDAFRKALRDTAQ
ncbi:methylamine utilization protein [Pseudomonas sp. MBLB4123]|uniref:methylamine utilization protein n=1 Tax=Pseudomonas sp. MBLB4123 TaxID=3451557 RepID=UPI003F7517A4